MAGEFAGSVAQFAASWVTRGVSVVQGVSSGVQGIQAIANGDLVGGMLQVAQGAADLFSATRSCFPAGTKLHTEGGLKAVEDITFDDRLLSRAEDDPDGPLAYRRVVQTFVRVAPILAVRVAGVEVRTTAEHPFYVLWKGWTGAAFLEDGDLLLSHDGQVLRVEGVTDTGEVTTVYNFQVEEFHTYFVGGDGWGFSIWAHNANNGYRGDDAPRKALSPKNGLRKPYINRAGDLRPASLTGQYKGRQVSVGEHVLGGFRGRAKSNSPFISLTPNGQVAAGYGKNVIKVDLKGLRAAIRSGEVKGVRIYTPSQVRRAIQRDPNLTPHWKKMATSFAIRDNEYLIQGVVPSRFLTVTRSH